MRDIEFELRHTLDRLEHYGITISKKFDYDKGVNRLVQGYWVCEVPTEFDDLFLHVSSPTDFNRTLTVEFFYKDNIINKVKLTMGEFIIKHKEYKDKANILDKLEIEL